MHRPIVYIVFKKLCGYIYILTTNWLYCEVRFIYKVNNDIMNLGFADTYLVEK